MPKPNTAAQADLPNPITAALADVLVGLETSFNRLSVVPLISRVPPAAPPYVTLDEALAGGHFEVTEISEAGRVPELHVLNRAINRFSCSMAKSSSAPSRTASSI